MTGNETEAEVLAITMPNEAATETLKRVAAHLAAGRHSGLALVFLTCHPTSVEMNSSIYNTNASGVVMSAIALLTLHIDQLRLMHDCRCPIDHAAEADGIEALVEALKSILGHREIAAHQGGPLH